MGPKYSFVTRKWEADAEVDRQHWSKFPAFQAYKKLLQDDPKAKGTDYDWNTSDFIFMRWKEQFLVPDHKIKSISGASFAGFYYIVFQKSTGMISGLYYHSHSEWFQHLLLTHVPNHSFGCKISEACFSCERASHRLFVAFEFR
jgi:hypothetical protein